MVDFNTRIYSEDDGRIIGAEVTVISTSGDNLGSISVANAETLAEMQAQLAVIDETYFTEERLAEILENINESQEINATTLNGFPSSNFAKVSQLSNYAPVSHNHSISQITGLYDYQITASKYNVDIDTDVTITVKVTNRATGQPVVGVTVPVLKNNQSWKSGTTGVNGTFSLTYTADAWGLVMFSANTTSTQICVTGFKEIQTGTNYTIYQNDNIIKARLRGNFSITANNEKTLVTINKNLNLQDSTCHHYATPSSKVIVYFQGNNINCFNPTNATSTYIFLELTHIIL